jgi:hypothetical protein
MNWHAELSDDAEQLLRRLPRRIQAQIERAIDALEVDPFQGVRIPRQSCHRFQGKAATPPVVAARHTTLGHPSVSCALLTS